MTAAGVVRATVGCLVLQAAAADPIAAPCAGDWCVVRSWDDGPLTVESVLPRRTVLVRGDVAGRSYGQVLAANADRVAIVASLEPLPVFNRIERLLTLAWESGAEPVIVLTKADLVTDAEAVAEDVAAAARGVPVLPVSVVDGRGLDLLRTSMRPHRTLALLGASGVGKSSLVNALVGTAVLGIREIRADGRGRHTTVRREVVILPGGGSMIDTPGLRGVGLMGGDGALAKTFPEVADLVGQCRFNDCGHESEPGCAVQAALADGRLAVRRWESWQKLQREQRWIAARTDARVRAERARERSLRERQAKETRRFNRRRRG